MLDRIRKAYTRSDRHGTELRTGLKDSRRQPLVEVLEGRQLLTASLAPIANITVPAQLGYQQALDGSGDTSGNQTFSATSSNPDIKVSVAQGQFWTLTVSHSPANSSDVTITNESMTFQLFGDLTPQTVSRITTLTNDNYYTTATLPNSNPAGPGKFIPRITSVASSGFSAIQGGSGSATSTASSSGVTPLLATEIAQQLVFTGQNQIAMANTGSPNSSDAQFFITNGTLSQSIQQTFDYNYSIFGQLVSGQQTVTDLSKVAVQNNTPPSGQQPEDSQPINPVTINSATLSSTNANGVLHIDTTGATAGETATITVTATDPTDHTTQTQTFTVTVGAYTGPTSSTTSTGTLNTPQDIQLVSTTPPTLAGSTITYKLLSQPANGVITQFTPSAGTLVYTPNTDFTGSDTFQYQVLAQPSGTTTPIPISMGTATVSVTAVATGAVHLIDNNVLVVTPLPRTNHGTDKIDISQVADSTVSGGQKIVVTVNGVPDVTQPPASSLNQIVVFGGKASTDIQVDSDVSPTIPITLDGGHGGNNVIQAGAGPTREHGWFGHTLLIGGTGSNELVGQKGFVRFKPTTTTKLIYAGRIKLRAKGHRIVNAPSGTYYRFVKGRLVPVVTT